MNINQNNFVQTSTNNDTHANIIKHTNNNYDNGETKHPVDTTMQSTNNDSVPQGIDIYENWYTDMLTNEIREIARIVTQRKLWNWFRSEAPPSNSGFMFWDHPNIKLISSSIENNQHSGSSFAFCLRSIHYIACHGLAEWNMMRMRDARQRNRWWD